MATARGVALASSFESIGLVLQVSFEAALGLFLISGVWSRAIRLVATTCFAVFTCVASYKAILGLPSCGCFGRVEVPPIYTAGFDLLVVLGLAWFVPPGTSVRMRRVGWGIVGVTLLVLVGMGLSREWIRERAIAKVDDAGALSSAGEIVILEPKEWVGKRLPILDYIEPAEVREALATGEWTLVLYHHDCGTCMEAMPGFEQRARQGERMVMVEMAPYGERAGIKPPAWPGALVGKLSEKRQWFATTPVVVGVADDKVTR